MKQISDGIRTISDFPKPGIEFKDITTLLSDGELFRMTTDAFAERYKEECIDMVVGVEARGFIFASALAYVLGAGTCLVRKPGKLPHTVHRESYELEYGTDSVEIHQDAFEPGQRIIVIDDILATGGTVGATAKLIDNNFDVEIIELAFLLELGFLNGREKLGNHKVFSLVES